MNHAVVAGPRAVALVVLVLLGTAFARADGLQPGLWRVLSRPVIDGVAGREQQSTRCLTPADVADLEKTFSPVGGTVNSTCEMVEHELTPRRLKWHLQCTGQLNTDVTGEFVFDAPDHYSATVSTKAAMAGQQIQASQVTIEATRVGECQ
jgi:hypothetical protein